MPRAVNRMSVLLSSHSLEPIAGAMCARAQRDFAISLARILSDSPPGESFPTFSIKPTGYKHKHKLLIGEAMLSYNEACHYLSRKPKR